MSTSQARAARGTDASNSIFFLVSQLIAVNLPELGSFQRLKHIDLARGTLRGASGKFFHAVGDNLRQLHYLLAQFSMFRNVALNTVAIGL